MRGRYFFDLDSEELSALYKMIQEQARQEERLAEKIASGEIYPTNHVITIGGNKGNKPVAGVTKWGFTGFKKGQLMIKFFASRPSAFFYMRSSSSFSFNCFFKAWASSGVSPPGLVLVAP